MSINVVTMYNNGEFLPNIILLTLCYYHEGNPIIRHGEILSSQPIFPPNKRIDNYPLLGGFSEGLDALRFCSKNTIIVIDSEIDNASLKF